jgi:hypothetical protein
VGTACAESVVGQPVFIARNLLTVVPAVAILLGLTLADRRLPKLAAGALLAAFLVLRTLQLAPAYGTSPEDWRAASAYVLAHARAGDCSAFYPADGHTAFAYYAARAPDAGRAPRSILPTTPWTRPPKPYVEDYATLPRARVNHLGCSAIWLISSHQGQSDGPAAARANLTRFKRLRRELEAAYPRHSRATFGYAATITVERLTRPTS